MEERFTMGQVAEMLGVTKNTLARWEKKWEKQKLSDFLPRRDYNGHRVYTSKQVEEIRKHQSVEESALYLARMRSKNGEKSVAAGTE